MWPNSDFCPHENVLFFETEQILDKVATLQDEFLIQQVSLN